MFVEHEEAMEVTDAPTKITKLSEAIRAGAKLRPKAMRAAFIDGKSCTWGAAWEGAGGQYDESISYSKIALELTDRFDAGQAYGGQFGSIAVMNDNGMSREKIADMLEANGY